MLGVAFAAQGMSQLANSIEALSSGRSACAQAMMAIDRKLGTEETTVTKKVGAAKNDEEDLEDQPEKAVLTDKERMEIQLREYRKLVRLQEEIL